jgi:hypothetical protein
MPDDNAIGVNGWPMVRPEQTGNSPVFARHAKDMFFPLQPQ